MSEQDGAVTEPRAPAHVVLALLRILAGHHGHASVTWHGQGFAYRLTAIRRPGDDATVDVDDSDPTALERDEALTAIRDHLRTAAP